MSLDAIEVGTALNLVAPSADPASTGGGLLERVALALNSTLDLEEVLRLLARIGIEATGAGGTAVMVLEGRRLLPAAVGRQVETDDLQARFHSMAPIELDDFQWELLCRGSALALEDARDHDVVPPELVDAFQLRGIALVPLMADSAPHGLMLVDWDEVRAFAPSDLAVLETIGAYAGMAVRNARLFAAVRRRARLQEALAESAASLALPLVPEVIARRLADCFTKLLGARLCGIALLDEERALITNIGSHGANPLAGPIPVADVPKQIVRHLTAAWTGSKKPVELPDDPWLAGFVGGRQAGASRYLAIPLVVGGHARGVVLLGFDSRTSLEDEELSAAEALADIAGAAIERYELLGRLDAQVGRLSALQNVAATLNSSAVLDSVLDIVCSAFESMLGTTHCSVNLLGGPDPHLLRTLAHRGITWFAGRPHSVSGVSPREVARVRRLWQEGPRPVVYPDLDDQLALDPGLIPEGVRSAVLFPLMHDERVVGLVVAGFATRGDPDAEDLEAGQALAALASSAIDRAGLTESLQLRLRQVEVLYRLSDVVAGTTDVNTAIAELNRLFRSELAVSFDSVSVASRALRDAVGARAPGREDLAAVRAWRRQLSISAEPLRPRATAGGLLVPVVHHRRVHGCLRVAVEHSMVTEAKEELLSAIGLGCGEVVYKAGLHRDLAERERRLAIAAERERIARDLHDSVGQVITGMGMLLSDYLADAPDDCWRARFEHLVALAGRGSREVRESIYALLFLDSRRGALVESLRELARTFTATTGIDVRVSLRGTEIPLPTAAEDALFRAAHEALMNVERHAQASTVSITISFGSRRTKVSVADDGVGIGQSLEGPESHHFGLTGVHQRLEEVGGCMRLSARKSGGAVLDAVVPKPAPRVTSRS